MNNSGLHPQGFTLLIKPEQIETTTKSGIVTVTEVQEERHNLAQIYGEVVEIGPLCWADEKDADGNRIPRCKVGDKVVYRRYSGEQFDGNDGLKYRIALDKDIYATKE